MRTVPKGQLLFCDLILENISMAEVLGIWGIVGKVGFICQYKICFNLYTYNIILHTYKYPKIKHKYMPHDENCDSSIKDDQMHAIYRNLHNRMYLPIQSVNKKNYKPITDLC